ncbi:MAG: hypothetical protein L3J76_05800 [Candidatus Hydrothermae bacterium]|nr:hypothetical protein [Candidatus Hydrothermae bacterium]
MRRWLARILQLVFLLLLAGVVWISGRGWVQTGERVLRLSLSRALKGDVRWTGVHIHFPDRLEIEHFEVDSVLRVDSLWLSVSIRNLLPLTFPRASIARIYVDIDAWLPRFWVPVPDTSAPPRAPLFPPLRFRQVKIREVTVRAVEGLYRARDLHLQYSMRISSMRAHLRIGTLYTPFERIYRGIVGSYLLTYPHHRPQQLVRVDSAGGTDLVRFLNLRTYRDTLRLTGLQLVLQEGLELQNFSVTLRLPAYRGPATVERVVLQHSGDTLQNLQGILARGCDLQLMIFLKGHGKDFYIAWDVIHKEHSVFSRVGCHVRNSGTFGVNGACKAIICHIVDKKDSVNNIILVNYNTNGLRISLCISPL